MRYSILLTLFFSCSTSNPNFPAQASYYCAEDSTIYTFIDATTLTISKCIDDSLHQKSTSYFTYYLKGDSMTITDKATQQGYKARFTFSSVDSSFTLNGTMKCIVLSERNTKEILLH